MIENGIKCKNFSELSEIDFKLLIDVWDKNKNSPKTITNKLSILRKVVLYASGNKNLVCIKYSSNYNSVNASKDFSFNIETINDCFFKNIVAFEIHFGLKKEEALKLNNIIILKNPQHLEILRTITTCNRGRFIPITTNLQKDIMLERINLIEKNVGQLFNYTKALSLYRAMAGYYKVPKNLRYMYFKNRYLQLKASDYSESEVINKIQKETGFQNKSNLQRIIWQYLPKNSKKQSHPATNSSIKQI